MTCKYCEKGFDNKLLYDHLNNDVEIFKGEDKYTIDVYIEGCCGYVHRIDFEIKYCPMCGRKLL